ncbi:MAG: glycogen synthase GlgA [Candidatus Didemnitutus sp.]|nr:glycogen synthase GlgA [Candidatus Didemnitutus sp.]
MQRLKVLLVTSEMEPFVKVGGLADMVGALPKEVAALGHDVRVVCPLYGSTKRVGTWSARPEPLGVDVGAQAAWARTWETTLPDSAVPAYFIEHEQYFGRPEVYSETDDNPFRFALFCRATLALCEQLDWIPDVIHCHDWTTGLLPVMLNTTLRDKPIGNAATVFTIHNMEHQGLSPHAIVDYARLPAAEYRGDSIESMGQVNMLKAALYHASKITTVSPTYAEEIRRRDGGCGLDHVLRFRGADLLGILNGVDTASWDPATDKALPANYTATDLAGKATCKATLQARLDLTVDAKVPVFGVVARLVHQKGLDLLAESIGHIVERMKVQFAVLGSGDARVEAEFKKAVARYPGRVGAHIGFDGKLARLIQAGSAAFVMPSRAEPCGLTQMYALRYGTLPIVRATGGLVDTVVDQGEQGRGTGFIFREANSAALYQAIGRACATYYDRPDEWRAMQLRGMAVDFSWANSAARYADCYRWAITARTGITPEA